MRKTIFWLFILILVSISWFRPLIAQTVSEDDLELIKKNPELYHQLLQQRGRSATNRYSTPPIYDSREVGGGVSQVAVQPEAPAIETTGALRPFGHEMFEREADLSAPIEIANGGDYVLGPGDNVLIYLWGKVEREFNLTIDRQGKVFTPPIGEIVAWGQTLDDFRDNLHAKFSRVYSDFDLNVTLGKIRSIRVYLIGEVKRPGAYTVSSLTTFFNALYQAGGPNERGSLRHIRLLRGGKLIREIDLYDFLIYGDNSMDMRLRSGDAIFVPVVEAQVFVAGEVRRPAIYELSGDETAADALILAGGATVMGYLSKVSLERMAQGSEPRLIDLNLDPDIPESDSASDKNFALLSGDRITVVARYDVQRNYVAVGGMVKQPGRYQRSADRMLSELIIDAELRPDDVYFERMNIFRTHPDNRREVIAVSLQALMDEKTRAAVDMALQDRDSAHIYSINEIKRVKHVNIGGEVKFPGQYELFDNMRLSDLIFLSGNLKRAAYMHRAELARTDSSGEVTLTYINLSTPMVERTILEEDDQVSIRQIPEWNLNRKVTIDGEVMFPGEYTLAARDETLWSLIQRAGEFTDAAFPSGLSLERQSISQSIFRHNLDRVVASSAELREDSLGNVRRRESVSYDAASLNRIIVDVPRIINSAGKEGDVILQPGDRIYVPRTPSGISVLGAVGANGTIRFEDKRKPKYYLERAGGFTKQADKDGMKLVKADGRVYSGSAARKQLVELGDAIVVPSEIKKDRNFMKSLSSLVTVISGLATSVFVITKL